MFQFCISPSTPAKEVVVEDVSVLFILKVLMLITVV